MPHRISPWQTFLLSSTDAASGHQFSPPVVPTPGACLSECLTDPQSGEGAEQVTAHPKMSRPLHNPCMYSLSWQPAIPSTRSEVFQQHKRSCIREERMVLASKPCNTQKVSMGVLTLHEWEFWTIGEFSLCLSLTLMLKYWLHHSLPVSDLWSCTFKSESGFVKLFWSVANWTFGVEACDLRGWLSSLSYKSD